MVREYFSEVEELGTNVVNFEIKLTYVHVHLSSHNYYE